MRASLNRPIRSISTLTETLSTESRLTAVRRTTGSAPGSSTTSLANPRMVVVHGAISARRKRGIATSRESTTTGRRPISGGSHHQSSPRNGSEIMSKRLQFETNQDRPIHQVRRSDGRRKHDRHHQSQRHATAREAQQGLRRKVRRHSGRDLPDEPRQAALHQQSCSP